MSQTVNGGTKASSANFSLVLTLGQPTQTQGVSSSANFRLQGGLIGANGARPDGRGAGAEASIAT